MSEKEKLEEFYKTAASLSTVLGSLMGDLADEDEEMGFDTAPILPYVMIASANMELCLQALKSQGLLSKADLERLAEEVNAEDDDDEDDDEE